MTTLKEIDIEDDRYMQVLDHGFVGLVDHMGSDDAVVQAARVSYGTGTKKVQEDRGLIRYLMRHEHTTPFEMCEVKFHIRLPIFVMRQLIRHRTAQVNEYSGRYSVMTDEFYTPETFQKQSTTNKQGREDSLEAIQKYFEWAEYENETLKLHVIEFDQSFQENIREFFVNFKTKLLFIFLKGVAYKKNFLGVDFESL